MKSSIKYSIIMPYYNRASQLEKTLESFCDLYKDRNDFEVLLIEDSKNHANTIYHAAFWKIVQSFKSKFNIYVLESTFNLLSPVRAFNYGVSQAEGQFVILTNPECLHSVDVLKGFDEEFARNEDCYVVCGCQALKQNGSFDMWYQHSSHRNVCLHFCTALSRTLFKLLEGFPVEFDGGYCFDDDAFREKVKRAGIPFVLRDDLLVTHQWHIKERPAHWRELWLRNKNLYTQMFSE